MTEIYCRDVTEMGCSITETDGKDRSITEILFLRCFRNNTMKVIPKKHEKTKKHENVLVCSVFFVVTI